MDAVDLVQELSIRIYEAPLTAHRDSGLIADTSIPLSVLMLVIDFKTEVEMNGIDNFFGNSTGLYARQTVDALELISCSEEARVLGAILDVAEAAGMTHERIQADREPLAEYAVTSWNELHAGKWEAASARIQELADTIAFEDLFERLAPFVERHRAVFEACLAAAGRP